MNYADLIQRGLSAADMALLDRIGAAADPAGVRVFLVGGAVRDIIAGTASPDLDVLVEGDAITLGKHLSESFNYKIKTYAEFGTATLFTEHATVDLVTARTETYSRPGALPEVGPASMEDDLKRRDFTINAMCFSLNSGSFGTLFDPFGGLDDLHAGTIRILHRNSFIDDPTRIFRAVRFKCRFGFNYDADTELLMKDAVARGAVGTVSGRRIYKEIRLIMKEKHRGGMMDECSRLKLDAALAPGISFTGRLLEPNDMVSYAASRLARCSGSDVVDSDEYWTVYLAAALLPDSIGSAAIFADRLDMNSKERHILSECPGIDNKTIKTLHEPDAEPSEITDILYNMPFPLLVIAHASGSDAVKGIIEDYCNGISNVRLEIGGRELIEMGLQPSEDIGRILRELLDLKKEGKLPTRADELAKAKELIAEISGPE